MRNKRKGPQVHTTSPYKRREGWINQYIVNSSDEETSSSDEAQEQTQEEEWEINGILDETDSQYLFDWVGPWSPTWEPKEYASEVAIQVWEEKKKQHAAVSSNTVSAQRSPTHSRISISDELAETPEQGPVPHSPLDSPLFVPLDPSSPDIQTSNQPPIPSGLATGTSSQSLADLKSPAEHHYDTVFESIPRAPIPLEYCLPGELEELPSSELQPLKPLGGASARLAENQVSTRTLFESPVLPRRKENTTVQPSPRAEIPETPSILLNSSQSQISQIRFQPGRSNSQRVVHSVDLSSSTLPSRPSLGDGSSPTNNSSSVAHATPSHRIAGSFDRSLTFVPESILANTLQSLTSQSLNTPALPPADSTSFIPSATKSRTSTLNTLPIPGSSAIGSQRTIGRTGLVPVFNTNNLHPQSRPVSTIRAAMDNQNQPKKGPPVAETMKKYSHLEGLTPREKLHNAYAKLREEGTVETLQNEASATPLSVGDIEASEPPTIPGTVAPLSVRVDKDTSHADTTQEPVPEALEDSEQTHVSETIQTIQPSALTIGDTEQQLPGSLHLGPSEFAIPLPMDSRVKDDYERVLSESHDVMARLDEAKSQGSEQDQAVSSMKQALECLSNAATHPDINVAQHMKDAESNLEQEAAWADYSSAKFLLLSYLIKAAGDHGMHLVIAVRGDKSQNVAERYLRGKGFSYTRPREEMGSGTNVEVSMAKGTISFGIQTTQNDGILETYKAPAALIALDSSLDVKNPSVEHMRTTFARNGHLLPLLRLFVASSSEHIELCFPGPSSPEHLSFLLRYSEQLIDIVGDLQDDALGVHEDATEIITCLLSDNFTASWSLPPIEPLREANMAEESEPEPEPEPEEPSQDNVEHEEPAISQAPKRLFVEESSEPSSKRPRVDDSQDISQFTVSSKDASQSLDSQIQFLEKNLIQMRTSTAADLEKLQNALAAAESRAQEAEKALGLLQHRYEYRTNDLHKIRKERDQLLQSKTTSEQRQEKQKEDLSKIKDERTQLKKDLEQASEALKSGGGDAAELEKAREETRRLEKENASLERKADFANKQAEYTREQYQTASNVAAQSGNELRQLKEENEALKTKAAGEAVRLRELNIQNDDKRHLKRIEELEALLSSREDLLHRKEDELREIRKNRPSTRSTSTQPRSPKLNAGNLSRPTSPGLNNNGNGNGNGSTFPGRGSALRFSSEMSF